MFHGRDRLRAVIPLVFGWLLAMTIPCASSQELSLDEWIRSQLPKQKPERVTILDIKLWPYGPLPNTYVILSVGRKRPETPDLSFPNAVQETQDFVLFLVQSGGSGELKNPRLIATYSLFSFTTPAVGKGPRRSIDVGPYQIRENEYAFGVRTIDDVGVGNKAGLAFEYISLFRYQGSEIKQILDDVTWGYSKYSEPGFRSCNTETLLVSEPPKEGEFFTLVRRHARSYLGDSRMYPQNPDAGTPVESCGWFDKLRSPNIHTWDAKQGQYVDAELSLRQQEIGKVGSPWANPKLR